MKRAVLLLLLTVMFFSLTACSGGIQGNEAKAYISDFFDVIEEKDYKLAATFLHPERPADLKVFFESVENEEDFDFASIEISQYTGFSSSYYDSSVAGSSYRLKLDAIVSDKKVEMEIEIVKNDKGYGIYNLDF